MYLINVMKPYLLRKKLVKRKVYDLDWKYTAYALSCICESIGSSEIEITRPYLLVCVWVGSGTVNYTKMTVYLQGPYILIFGTLYFTNCIE